MHCNITAVLQCPFQPKASYDSISSEWHWYKMDLCRSHKCMDGFWVFHHTLLFLQVACLLPAVATSPGKTAIQHLVFSLLSHIWPKFLFMARYSNPTEEVCHFLMILLCLPVSGFRIWQMIWEATLLFTGRDLKQEDKESWGCYSLAAEMSPYCFVYWKYSSLLL